MWDCDGQWHTGCDVHPLVSKLYSAKSTNTLERTNMLLNSLIARVVQSGTITAVFAVVELVLFILEPETYLHICLDVELKALGAAKDDDHAVL
ncbi:hypothetical protein H0H92_007038 [Tricholoma furcatifolium]|nr:hypothetical protein H0H92_007038 [Tricholoma furcatifolium]